MKRTINMGADRGPTGKPPVEMIRWLYYLYEHWLAIILEEWPCLIILTDLNQFAGCGKERVKRVIITYNIIYRIPVRYSLRAYD